MSLPCEVYRGTTCPSCAKECLFDDPTSPECRPTMHKASSWNVQNPVFSVVPVPKRKIGMNRRTALVLGRGAYKFQFLFRTRLVGSVNSSRQCSSVTRESRNPGLFELRLVP